MASHRFVDALRALERDRRGEAILDCRQFRLISSVNDRAGHVGLHAVLIEHQSGGNHQVAIVFEVDPASLSGILRDIEDLIAFPKMNPLNKGTMD